MDNSLNYIKFRYDFLNDDEHPYTILAMLFDSPAKYPFGVMGVETCNARGVNTKRHLHFNFATEEKPESLRKRFMRHYGEDAKKRGRGWYSLVHERDVRDFNHFFRYPIKQIEPISFDYKYGRVPLPPDFDILQQNILAYEEWAKGKDILTKNEIKRDSRLSTYEKILDIVQSDSPDLNSLQDCKLYVLRYFMENNIPPNKLKVCDIANGVALTLRLITYEEFLGM